MKGMSKLTALPPSFFALLIPDIVIRFGRMTAMVNPTNLVRHGGREAMRPHLMSQCGEIRMILYLLENPHMQRIPSEILMMVITKFNLSQL